MVNSHPLLPIELPGNFSAFFIQYSVIAENIKWKSSLNVSLQLKGKILFPEMALKMEGGYRDVSMMAESLVFTFVIFEDSP